LEFDRLPPSFRMSLFWKGNLEQRCWLALHGTGFADLWYLGRDILLLLFSVTLQKNWGVMFFLPLGRETECSSTTISSRRF